MDDILEEAYDDLKYHDYEEGDEIYIFGFSRGAAIARMFAASLDKKVTFLGVFDTVAATRGSLDLNPESYPSSGIVFENGTVGSHVQEAVHLVSIDEKRLAFQPTLFNKDDRVTEVWFTGVHSDIGGGYWFDGLSDITLQFMIDRIKSNLHILEVSEIDYEDLKIKGAQEFICIDDLNIVPLLKGKVHEQRRTGIKAKTLAPRLVRVNVNDHPSKHIPTIHHTVSERFHTVTQYRPYALRNVTFNTMNENGKVDLDTNYVGITGLSEGFEPPS